MNYLRKIFSTFIFILVFTVAVQAQNFKGGILGGFVSTQVDGDQYGGYNKSSISFGAFVNRRINQDIGLQMEIRYTRKGARYSDLQKGGNAYYVSKLNYIEIPVFGRYHINKFIFEGGLAVGVLVNSSEEDLYGTINSIGGTNFNTMEISGLAGFSYTITDDFFINFRMQYSILPIRTNFTTEVPLPNYHQKYSFNNLIGFSVYYII